MRRQTIDLGLIGKGMPGLTEAYAQTLGEAAAVCLEGLGHKPKTARLVATDEFTNEMFGLEWEPCNEYLRRCYADPQEATEQGAYGLAIEIAKEFTGMVVVERSRKGTGFDYWLGHEDDLLFEGKARLEVSGILKGDTSRIQARLREKLIQLDRSDDFGLPGYVAIIEFSRPEARCATKP